MTSSKETPSLRRDPPPGYVMQSRDTEYWAEEAQFEHWGRMDLETKAEHLRALCLATAEAHMCGLRSVYPDASEHELLLRSAALRYGNVWVRNLTGFDADPERG